MQKVKQCGILCLFGTQCLYVWQTQILQGAGGENRMQVDATAVCERRLQGKRLLLLRAKRHVTTMAVTAAMPLRSQLLSLTCTHSAAQGATHC
jgi:hypothetical protein